MYHCGRIDAVTSLYFGFIKCKGVIHIRWCIFNRCVHVLPYFDMTLNIDKFIFSLLKKFSWQVWFLEEVCLKIKKMYNFFLSPLLSIGCGFVWRVSFLPSLAEISHGIFRYQYPLLVRNSTLQLNNIEFTLRHFTFLQSQQKECPHFVTFYDR